MKINKVIGQVLKWLFSGGYVPVYDLSVIYAVVGSFKTNAELTLGGGFFPEMAL